MPLFDVRQRGRTIEIVLAPKAQAVKHALLHHEYWCDDDIVVRLRQPPVDPLAIIRCLPPSPCNRLCGGLPVDVAAQTWPGA